MFANPIEEGAFETDVIPLFLGLNPLVSKNFFTFGQKLLVEGRTLGKSLLRSGFWGRGGHIYLLWLLQAMCLLKTR
jgi:hypothetical protein